MNRYYDAIKMLPCVLLYVCKIQHTIYGSWPVDIAYFLVNTLGRALYIIDNVLIIYFKNFKLLKLISSLENNIHIHIC